MQRTRRPVPGLVAGATLRVSLSRNCDVSEELSGAGGGSTLFIPDPLLIGRAPRSACAALRTDTPPEQHCPYALVTRVMLSLQYGCEIRMRFRNSQ